jgi:succinate-semialdehyde dehydrogenase/glutarate-semialdehyde dehydrogenase
VYDAFAEKLAAAVRQMEVGPAVAGNVQQGPLIKAKAVAKVTEHVEDAVAKGARVVTGGQPHALGGNFYQPTVLADVTEQMLVARGNLRPAGATVPLYSEEEAIRLANATEFGLAAYFYSRDIGRIWRVAEAIEAGMVGINEGIISTEVAPFGGIKESGLGRGGAQPPGQRRLRPARRDQLPVRITDRSSS